MKVAAKPPVLVQMPAAPKGANGPKPRITDRLYHEADSRGYIPPGHTHIFMIAAEGSGAIQLTTGDFNHRGPISWSPDGTSIYFSANRSADWEYDFRNSEVYTLTISDKKITVLTDRQGPDSAPQIAPNGKYIAYIGYTDRVQAYKTGSCLLCCPTEVRNNYRVAPLTRVFNATIGLTARDFMYNTITKGTQKLPSSI